LGSDPVARGDFKEFADGATLGSHLNRVAEQVLFNDGEET